MDQNAKKIALRMIPYGLYVLTAQTGDGRISGATVNWVTQASFQPPLVAVAVKSDSTIHGLIKDSQAFALNILGKDQGAIAFAFFKPVVREGQTLGGQPFHAGATGSPILDSAAGFIECRLVEGVEKGDHSIFVGEVVDAGVSAAPAGRPDDVTLWLKDLGENLLRRLKTMKHFVIEVTYSVPFEQMAHIVPDHRAFLQLGYDRGWLLMSGPQVPKTGGMIVARAPSLVELQQFFQDDPFLKNSVATYRYVEFEPVKRQALLEDWLT